METQNVPKLMRMAIIVSLFSILFGFVLGGLFGAVESSIKNRLNNIGNNVLQTVYHGDVAAKDTVVKKSWEYLQRAHLHGGSIGTAALASIITLIVLSRLGRVAQWSALAFASGALLYSLYWLLAGFTAPGIGSTSIAKESLSFIAIPGAALCLLGLCGTLCCLIKTPR